jgi:hypothetical protein
MTSAPLNAAALGGRIESFAAYRLVPASTFSWF